MWNLFKKQSEIKTPHDLEQFLLGVIRQSASGITITPDIALTCSPVYASINVISESIGQLPLYLYERVGNDRKRAVDHPLFKLLIEQPNEYLSSVDFQKSMQANLSLYGNAYALIIRVGSRPIELHILHPAAVAVDFTNNKLVYKVKLKDGAEREYSSNEIFHLRGFSRNGYLGESPIDKAKEAIATSLAAEKFGALFFKNGAKTRGAFSLDGKLGDDAFDRLKEQLNNVSNGDNTHSTPLLEQGLKWIAMDHSAKDSQLIELRQFQIVEIARFWRVQPHLIQHLIDATFSNIENQGRDFLTNTLSPQLEVWEQAVTRQLITDKNKYFVEFDTDKFSRGDNKSRGELYSKAIGGPWMTINEGRRKDNLPDVDGGNELLKPLNMGGLNEDQTDT